MDIGAFLSNAWGQASAFVSVAVISLAIAKFKDFIMFKLLTVFGEKYKKQIGNIIKNKIVKLLNLVRELDDKFLDPFKEKFPKTGAAVENEIADALDDGASTLHKAAKIVRDEQ